MQVQINGLASGSLALIVLAMKRNAAAQYQCVNIYTQFMHDALTSIQFACSIDYFDKLAL